VIVCYLCSSALLILLNFPFICVPNFSCLLGVSFASLNRMTSFPHPVTPDWRRFTVSERKATVEEEGKRKMEGKTFGLSH
jgi:hypothetical protein